MPPTSSSLFERCSPMESTCHLESNRPQDSRTRTGCGRSSRHYMTDTRFGRRDPNARGYYGEYGGKFVPETLVAPVEELQHAYYAARQDASFLQEFDRLL